MPHKLLLADDSVTIQRVIELTFADEDVQVQAVGDGMKAIASIQADRPDIVLADVGMPERDGYEVAAFVKGDPQLAHIPVLLLTGAFEPVDETRARAVGCDGVLVKPFEPQMVINRVKDLLAGRRPAGLWTQPQTVAAPVGRTAQSDIGPDPRAGGPKETPAPSASLEDYFDRLDAAFASLDGGAPAESASIPTRPAEGPPPAPVSSAPSPVDDLAGWDPDLTGDPARPVSIEPPPVDVLPNQAVAPPAPQRTAPVQPAAAQPAASPYAQPAAAATMPPAVPVPPLPSLAEAFAALLSAEQSRQIAPSTIGGPPQIGDDVIDEVVRRVVARLGDSVLEAAERLVKEEIDRIKRG